MEGKRVVWQLVADEIVPELADLFRGEAENMQQGQKVYYGYRVVL